MRKLNTTLDREPMNSEAIRQRQNFNYILKETVAAKVPIWKSIWFYGPVGIAMVTMVVSAVRMNPQNEINDKTITLAKHDVTEWSASTTIQDAKSKKGKTVVKADKGSISEPSKSTKKERILVEKLASKAVKTEKSQQVENNTQLKPGVIAEEKNASDNNRKDLNKIAPVVDEYVVVKTAKTMPNIAGVFSGRIPISQICSIGKIDCNNGYHIVSYDIEYDNGTGSVVDRISGEEIPRQICASLQRYNVGIPVFITNIIAMNDQGERKKLLSMSIEPTF